MLALSFDCDLPPEFGRDRRQVCSMDCSARAPVFVYPFTPTCLKRSASLENVWDYIVSEENPGSAVHDVRLCCALPSVLVSSAGCKAS